MRLNICSHNYKGLRGLYNKITKYFSCTFLSSFFSPNVTMYFHIIISLLFLTSISYHHLQSTGRKYAALNPNCYKHEIRPSVKAEHTAALHLKLEMSCLLQESACFVFSLSSNLSVNALFLPPALSPFLFCFALFCFISLISSF